MAIHQFLETFANADAIGYDALGIREIIYKSNIKSDIYADNIHFDKLENYFKFFIDYKTSKKDTIIYHSSIYWDKLPLLLKSPGKKVMIFHNITPPSYFNYRPEFRALLEKGYKQLNEYKNLFDKIIVDSSFNKEVLVKMGCNKQINIIPPFVDLKKKFSVEPNKISLIKNKKTKIIFVSQFAPHKRQDELVKAFKVYQELYNPLSELWIIGNFNPCDAYLLKVKSLVGDSNDIKLTGKISLEDLAWHYKSADVFLCLSEHEGFAVPIVESMYFGVPIIAYSAGAVEETMGSGGILLKKKDPLLLATVINELVKNKELYSAIKTNQLRELNRFNSLKITKELKKCLLS